MMTTLLVRVLQRLLFVPACLAISAGSIACTPKTEADEDPAGEPSAEEPGKDEGEDAPAAVVEEGLPPPPSDDRTKPEERPLPQSTVRECGRSMTKPKALRVNELWVGTRPIRLGAAYIDGKVDATKLWVEGSHSTPSSGMISAAAAGPDGDPGTGLGIESVMGRWNFDNFTIHLGGKGPLEIWSDALKPTALRINYSLSFSQKADGWTFRDEARTAQAPDDDKALFVSEYGIHRYVGVALVATFPDACAVGAMGDVLGRRAMLKNGLGVVAGTMFDPAKRDAVQKIMVREGVELRIAVVSNKERATLHSVIASTACNPGNFGACVQLLEALELRAQALSGITDGDKDIATVSSGASTNWSVSYAGARELVTVP